MSTKLKRKKLRQTEVWPSVDAIANVHSHIREIGDEMKDFIALAIQGGVDYLLPMPNTKTPLLQAIDVMLYREAAQARVPKGAVLGFIPTIYITESTTLAELEDAVQSGIKDGKIYPFFRTTNSEHGVKHYGKILRIVNWCGKLGIKVHVHFEHPNPEIIDRDAEYLCIPIAQMFLEESDAILIWEHGTDGRCIPLWKHFAKTFPGRFYVTLTAHHLATNEDKANGDVRSRCKPTIKTEPDRNALVQLVSEGHDWVMLGADDAPHDVSAKHVHEGQCACGAYTAPFLAQLCAHALGHLLTTERGIQIFNGFISRNARKLHNLPPAYRKLTLVKTPLKIPPSYKAGSWTVEPFWSGRSLDYSLA